MFLYFHCQLMFSYVNDVQEILFYIQYGIVNVIEFLKMQKNLFIHTIVIYSVKKYMTKQNPNTTNIYIIY